MATEAIRSNVLAALVELASSGTTLIKPMFDPQAPNGVSYPEADEAFNTKGAETEELLENLHRAGMLKRTLLDVIRACPVCGHVDVEAREACPSCKSPNLTVGDRKVSCMSCGTVSQSPEFVLHCSKCGNLFPQEAAKLRPLFAYLIAKSTLTEQERTAKSNVIEITGRLVLQTPLMEEMRRVMESMTERIEKAVNRLVETSGRLEAGSQATGQGRAFTRTTLSPALRKTLEALSQVGSATAEEVSSLTGRTRPLESVYLNQLAYMGYATKERKGQRIYFRSLNQTMLEMK
ncbi:MAG: hypothetical protein NZ988_05575 [Thaumarchaeota archaeon]|nr:hypothetical protein [Candidatus Calditenuaceae archaeon]MDW8187492.1 hypothetical protein [Nitrososphaerota archaeon]